MACLCVSTEDGVDASMEVDYGDEEGKHLEGFAHGDDQADTLGSEKVAAHRDTSVLGGVLAVE